MEKYPLHRAAEVGDLEKLKRFINEDANYWKDNLERTPLHFAAKCGHFEVAEYLLRNKRFDCYKSYKDYTSVTPLLLAAQHGHRDIVNLLLRFNSEVRCYNGFGKWTVLHYASKGGWTEVVQQIVDREEKLASNKDRVSSCCGIPPLIADLNAKTSLGMTSLMMAAEEGHLEVVKVLIKAGAQLNICDDDSWTALHWACKRGWIQIVKSIVETPGCDLNAKNAIGNTPLHISCDMNNPDIIQLLLKAGADCRIRNNKELEAFAGYRIGWAARVGDLERVKQCIDFGVSMEILNEYEETSTALHTAARFGWYEITKLLVNNKCSVNSKNESGHTPLWLASKHGHKDIVDLLLGHGALISLFFVDECKYTLLHWATEHGWEDVVQLIIQDGKLDVNSATLGGETALIRAAKHGREKVASILIRAKADINRCDKYKGTALHYASVYGHEKVVKVLLETGGINLNPQDEDGDTPLHKACSKGHDGIVKMLLKAGALTNIKNNDNKTAFNLWVTDKD